MTQHPDRGPSVGRVILTTIEIAAIGGAAYLGFLSLQKNGKLDARLEELATQLTGLVTPTSQPRLGDNLLVGTPIPGSTPFESTQLSTATLESRPNGLSSWPDTPEKIAAMCGGDASQWQRNPEWPDSRTIDNPALSIKGYINREWRPTNPENLPFSWPKTAEEALKYFFPGQDINPKFIQPAWIDPSTGQITGWHLSEDHWLDGGPADVTLLLHPCEVAEGYTVNGTLDPVDDRNWVAYGGANKNGNGGTAINLAKGQGMTMWMPGTDPNAVGLRMELFVGADTLHYRGSNGEQLGPDAIGFTPVYPYPKDSKTGFIGPSFTPVKTGLETMDVKGQAKQLGGGIPQTVRRPQDLGRNTMTYQKNPFKGQIRF